MIPESYPFVGPWSKALLPRLEPYFEHDFLLNVATLPVTTRNSGLVQNYTVPDSEHFRLRLHKAHFHRAAGRLL